MGDVKELVQVRFTQLVKCERCVISMQESFCISPSARHIIGPHLVLAEGMMS